MANAERNEMSKRVHFTEIENLNFSHIYCFEYGKCGCGYDELFLEGHKVVRCPICGTGYQPEVSVVIYKPDEKA